MSNLRASSAVTPEAEKFCSLMPRKLLINPSKLIPRRGNEPLRHYNAT